MDMRPHIQLKNKRESKRPNGLDSKKRYYPSGGGLYESEIFLLVHQVNGLESGMYFFDSEKRVLGLVKPLRELPEELILFPYQATGQRLDPPVPQIQVLIVADIKRLAWAYKSIVYRTALTNASILMSQGLLLAEAMGFAAVPMGMYPSEHFAEAIGIEEFEYPLMTQFCLIGKAGRNRT